jgi:hypothetical protein
MIKNYIIIGLYCNKIKPLLKNELTLFSFKHLMKKKIIIII